MWNRGTGGPIRQHITSTVPQRLTYVLPDSSAKLYVMGCLHLQSAPESRRSKVSHIGQKAKRWYPQSRGESCRTEFYMVAAVTIEVVIVSRGSRPPWKTENLTKHMVISGVGFYYM